MRGADHTLPDRGTALAGSSARDVAKTATVAARPAAGEYAHRPGGETTHFTAGGQ